MTFKDYFQYDKSRIPSQTGKVLTEAIVVGLLVVVFAIILSWIVSAIGKAVNSNTKIHPQIWDWGEDNWWPNLSMILVLFMTGSFLHLTFEVGGLNAAFCSESY